MKANPMTIGMAVGAVVLFWMFFMGGQLPTFGGGGRDNKGISGDQYDRMWTTYHTTDYNRRGGEGESWLDKLRGR